MTAVTPPPERTDGERPNAPRATGEERDASPRRAKLWVVMAAVLVVAPALVALGAELFTTAERWAPFSDQAVLELHTLHAGTGEHLHGPYSRYEWHHPGPLYYFLLTPLYQLSGHASWSLNVTVGLLNLLAVGAMLLLYLREERHPLGRLAFCALLAAFVADFATLYGPSGLTETWNPFATVLPFGLLLVSSAAVAAGRVALLPACVLLHALLVQTHVSYGLCATALVLVTLVLLVRDRSQRPPKWWWRQSAARRGLLGAVGVALVVWLPTVLAELRPGPSNLGRLFRFFFMDGDERGVIGGAGACIAYASRQLFAPLLRAVGLGEPTTAATMVAVILLVCQGGLLAVSYHRGRRRGRRFAAASCLLGAVTLIGACWSCAYAGQLEPRHYYLTLWFALLGTLNWAAILSAWLPDEAEVAAGRGVRRQAVTLACLLPTALLSIVACVGILRGYGSRASWPPHQASEVTSIAAHLGALFRAADVHAPVLRIASHDAWGVFAGVLLELQKRGFEPRLEQRWRFMFGGGLHYLDLGPDDPDGVFFSLGRHHDKRLLARHGEIFLYASGLTASARMPSAATLRLAATGIVGDPLLAIDLDTPADGTTWDSPRAVQLTEPSSSITLQLPQAFVATLEVSADANDAYLIEGSRHGRTFQPIGLVPPVAGPGLRRRQVALEDTGPWAALRVSPKSGDGSYAVAEIAPRMTGWGATVVRSADTIGDARVAADGIALPDGSSWRSSGTLVLKRTGALTVRLPWVEADEGYVEGIRLSADGNDEYRVAGSRDGRRFSPIGTMRKVHRAGLQTRSFFFNDRILWTHIRITPGPGDGDFSISEVTPLVADGRLIDFGTPSARPWLMRGWSHDEWDPQATWVWATRPNAQCEVPLREGTSYDMGMALLPLIVPDRPQWLDVRVNGQPLSRIWLPPRPSTHHVQIPGDLVRSLNRFEFDFAYALPAPGSDPRVLAVRFDSILLQPTSGPAAGPSVQPSSAHHRD